ncbi:MAG TPA: epoxide hydrolase N-terminal domain-containing protein, partial [Nocardioides sp.]|nr:epoxide hydrolase N-terminal domain-containing protein [Nocardioides sp.]
MTTEKTQSEIQPFTIAIPESALEDLRDRLARTRLPQPAPGDSWAYGTPTSYLRDMVERW